MTNGVVSVTVTVTVTVKGKGKTAFKAICGCGCDEGLSGLYRSTFGDPRNNPRWECGFVAHCVVVEREGQV